MIFVEIMGNMENGLTIPKWMLIIRPKMIQMSQNLSASRCPDRFNHANKVQFHGRTNFQTPFSPATSGVTKPPLQRLRGKSHKSYKEAFIKAYFLIEGLTPTYGGLKAPTINFLHVNTPISE